MKEILTNKMIIMAGNQTMEIEIHIVIEIHMKNKIMVIQDHLNTVLAKSMIKVIVDIIFRINLITINKK
jgi:hypothetical protein